MSLSPTSMHPTPSPSQPAPLLAVDADAAAPAVPGRKAYVLRNGKPDAKFMLSHPAHILALGFGSGLSPVAPGTAGTLWAWLAYLLLQPVLTSAQMGWLIAASTLAGWWACTVTARNMRVLDPGSIVWDEVVAFWLVLWLVMPTGFGGQLAAFALFRFFDAVKPGPVAWADQKFKGFNARGGFGILFDDTVAAFCTLLVIAVWRFW
ncbi:MAG: phosphatidylglycerophosphatase [Polaromonas sp.]|nr:phosphatidylglycerophosphatase [Polaromonas sp.]